MILIATGSTRLQSAYQRKLQRYGRVVAVPNRRSLQTAIERMTVQLMFVDHALPGFHGGACVRDLCDTSPLSTVLLIANGLSAVERHDLFNAGAYGICDPEIDCFQLTRIFRTLERGERWVGCSGVESTGKRIQRSSVPESATSQLFHLTYREKEIARMIGDGHSNATIAQQVRIAERTVKSHLSEIFRKLDIADRRALAMRVVARS